MKSLSLSLPEPGRAARGVVLTTLAALLLAGCGVRPTGVLDGGEAAGGLTKGLRLYFVSQAGRLEGVSRPSIPATRFTDPKSVIKLLLNGPAKPELANGLTTLLGSDGSYDATVAGGRVTVHVPQGELSGTPVENRNLIGQLVCSIARARAMADTNGTTRTDDIRVTIRPRGDARPGTYVCSDFLK
ncbi:GerMN domain-containing protein [Streptomyces flavofungini]|uniref:GerMN domain-containing protein n=1 Tax=Streptomyces flavofungini TaxID=68200 RepID=UPI0025B0BB2B|nr:hypothetical protein [Streptomyces flavofungini]WJV47937.1 hypothetical protein QUY26_21935 [Streptomyces flavofungini]